MLNSFITSTRCPLTDRLLRSAIKLILCSWMGGGEVLMLALQVHTQWTVDNV